MKKLVAQYEALRESLPPPFRPKVWETVAYYHARVGEKEKSSALYEKIENQFPTYENIQEVRQKLAALK